MWSLDDGIHRLRQSGAKITAQRIAILQSLEGRTDHPSADDLYREVRASYPTLSIATVYSTAKMLVDAGLVKVLTIDDKRVYFDPGVHQHGHFMCTSCGRLSDITFEDGALSIKNHVGRIERTEMFVYGCCSDCCLRENRDTLN